MAESKLPYEGLVVKRKTFSGTPNTGGGIAITTESGISADRFICFRSTTSERMLLDIGNGFGLVVDNQLNIKTSGTVNGVLYYY